MSVILIQEEGEGYLIEFKEPPITIKLETLDTILVVHVSSGQDKPYSCSSGFYIRVGPNAQKMSRNQIIEFFQSKGQIRFEELMNLSFDVQTDEGLVDIPFRYSQGISVAMLLVFFKYI